MLKKKFFQDKELVDAIRSGGRDEGDAIAFLLKNELPKISNMIVQRNGSSEDAEDILQEALGVVIYNVKKGIFKHDSSLSTYLFSICKGMWYKLFRKYTRERDQYKMLAVDDRDENTPEVSVLDREQKNLLAKLFDKLKEGCKDVLFRWSIGESMEDIAKMLSLKNAQIAMNKKNKCLKELHERMDSDPSIAFLIKAINESDE